MKFADCQGLGGGLTLGFVQAGFDLVGKVEQKGDFGYAQCNSNRHLLGDDWDYTPGPADNWPTYNVPVVAGNPPCSGFSMMSVRAGSGRGRGDKRGAHNSINSCMWDFAGYVGRVRPEVAVMESVPTAGKEGKAGGRVLMRQLRDIVEEETGKKYDLNHVFHNALGCGGSSVRSRYFMVLSRRGLKFGVNAPVVPPKVPWLRDVIGDLVGAELTMDPQPYPAKPGWWAAGRTAAKLTGHDISPDTPHQLRIFSVAEEMEWPQGEPVEAVLERYYEEHGRFPDGWGEMVQNTILHRPLARAIDWDAIQAGDMTEEQYVEKWNVPLTPGRPKAFQSGAYSTKRWYWEKAGRVLTGGGMVDNIHPVEPRTFTYREAARIMGFPDTWDVSTYADGRQDNVFGKGVIVDVGRWIGTEVLCTLNGEPGSFRGEELTKGEYLIDVSRDWRAVYDERTGAQK